MAGRSYVQCQICKKIIRKDHFKQHYMKRKCKPKELRLPCPKGCGKYTDKSHLARHLKNCQMSQSLDLTKKQQFWFICSCKKSNHYHIQIASRQINSELRKYGDFI